MTADDTVTRSPQTVNGRHHYHDPANSPACLLCGFTPEGVTGRD